MSAYKKTWKTATLHPNRLIYIARLRCIGKPSRYTERRTDYALSHCLSGVL